MYFGIQVHERRTNHATGPWMLCQHLPADTKTFKCKFKQSRGNFEIDLGPNRFMQDQLKTYLGNAWYASSFRVWRQSCQTRFQWIEWRSGLESTICHIVLQDIWHQFKGVASMWHIVFKWNASSWSKLMTVELFRSQSLSCYLTWDLYNVWIGSVALYATPWHIIWVPLKSWLFGWPNPLWVSANTHIVGHFYPVQGSRQLQLMG